MSIEVFQPQLIEHVKLDALKHLNDETCYTVLLTGRIPKFSKIVKEITRLGGLPYFNEYFFNDSSNTLQFKLKILEHLRSEFPHVQEFEMWEDRVEHIPHFIEWGTQNYGDGFKLNQIEGY